MIARMEAINTATCLISRKMKENKMGIIYHLRLYEYMVPVFKIEGIFSNNTIEQMIVTINRILPVFFNKNNNINRTGQRI